MEMALPGAVDSMRITTKGDMFWLVNGDVRVTATYTCIFIIKSAKHDSRIRTDECKNIVKQLKAGSDRDIHVLKQIISSEKSRVLNRS